VESHNHPLSNDFHPLAEVAFQVGGFSQVSYLKFLVATSTLDRFAKTISKIFEDCQIFYEIYLL